MADNKDINCGKCGQLMPHFANFCENCGAPLTPAAQAQAAQAATPAAAQQPQTQNVQQQPTQQQPAQQGQSSQKGCLIAILIGGGLILLSMIVSAILFFVVFSEAIKDLPDDAFDTPAAFEEYGTKNEGKLELVGGSNGATMVKSSYSLEITGKIKNISEEKFGYVSVAFSLYDAEGSKIGTAIDSTSDLAPGDVWAFEALGVRPDKVTSYKLEKITAF
ncbi:hypothetical protein Dip510_000339 [Elusimicrobium posterum]|uniref:FxLYD domain-containing protein n=1 Tax=Elusimicrobium posterum TaxID=3116653 RepID=UPI003C75D768